MRNLISLSAACLLAGAAWAQQGNPQNPHSVQSKDQPGSSVPQSVTNQQAQDAQQANPHSVQSTDKQPANPSPSDNEAMQHHPETAQPGATTAEATPQVILQRLHLANLEEIELGKMAEQNGSDKVKDYARMLQTDHKAADQKVTALAQKKGIMLSDKPAVKPEAAQKHQEAKEKLASLKGEDFDRAFTGLMVKGHQHLISAVQHWQSTNKDPDVNTLLDAMMPKLQQHEQMAEKLHGPMPQGKAPSGHP
jgi:putative membrane protein